MKICVLLSLVLGCVHVHGAPVGQEGLEPGSCEDAQAVSAAHLALTKINRERKDGYVLSLHRLSNVHMASHGETGVVFYLTLDVVETNCSVLSKRDWKTCEARPIPEMPVYGQCTAAIYINRVHRVVRLYQFDCALRPVPTARVTMMCPDCPALMSHDEDVVKDTVSQTLEKFNKESGLKNRFALLHINRATAGMGAGMYYHVEYTIQETNCLQSTEATENCTPMECEFAHKGFCKGSIFNLPMGGENVNVECEIYEPEAAEREKKLHLLGGETDHSHNDTHAHSHDQDSPHAADQSHSHDHVHDHTKGHAHHDNTQVHADGSDHHHTHDHAAGSPHRHAHDHSHDHGHGHDHVHAHHAKAHDHSGDSPNHHHDYKHPEGAHTHEHDHELALDHDHKHAHLHDHEHHHHHHKHDHETDAHDHPQGRFRLLPPFDLSLTPPPFIGSFRPTQMPIKPDPQIPGMNEPTILVFPVTVSAQCIPPGPRGDLVGLLLSEDPLFKPSA